MLSIYNPEAEISPVYVNTASPRVLRYNHDIDVVKFKGRYYAAWNANAAQGEDLPGQYNYLAVSDDYITWSDPYPFLADHHCVNPVSSDNQWQPVFINYRDEKLFCVWCDFWARKTFVAVTTDGNKWKNSEVPNAPEALRGKVIGFPTNHGFVSSGGRLIAPCSLPPYFDDGKRFYEIEGLDFKLGAAQYGVGLSKYCANLLSDDAGETWYWSEPVEAVKWSEIGEDPALHGGEDMIVWEPSVFETPEGRMGLLVRNSTSQNYPARKDDSHHMLLCGWSDDGGKSWSKVTPVEVETTYSRNVTLCGTPDNPSALLMVHNDNPVNSPARIPMDRYNLSLFVAPVPDPDLLLPGPLVQPASGRAFYPNAFIDGQAMRIGYTTGSNSMYVSTIAELPNFTEPFLMPRDGRPGLVMSDNKAVFTQNFSTLGLVLTPELTRTESIVLAFQFQVNLVQHVEKYLPILTLGGKSRNGLSLVIALEEPGNKFKIGLLELDGKFTPVDDFTLQTMVMVNVTLEHDSVAVKINGKQVKLPVAVLRKIAFGGLYAELAFPWNCLTPGNWEIPLASIEISGFGE